MHFSNHKWDLYFKDREKFPSEAFTTSYQTTWIKFHITANLSHCHENIKFHVYKPACNDQTYTYNYCNMFDTNQPRMQAENKKNKTAIQKWKLDSPIYFRENWLYIFQAQPDTING
jgi:hypothetical protein